MRSASLFLSSGGGCRPGGNPAASAFGKEGARRRREVVKWIQQVTSVRVEGADGMTYFWAILVVVVGVGSAVVFWRWRQWSRNDDGLGARLSDQWEGWEDER